MGSWSSGPINPFSNYFSADHPDDVRGNFIPAALKTSIQSAASGQGLFYPNAYNNTPLGGFNPVVNVGAINALPESARAFQNFQANSFANIPYSQSSNQPLLGMGIQTNPITGDVTSSQFHQVGGLPGSVAFNETVGNPANYLGQAAASQASNPSAGNQANLNNALQTTSFVQGQNYGNFFSTPGQQAQSINDSFIGRNAFANPGNSTQALNSQGGNHIQINSSNAAFPDALDTPLPYNPQSPSGVETFPGGFNGPYFMYQSNMGGQQQVRPSDGVGPVGSPLTAYPYDVSQNTELGGQFTSGQINASQFFTGVLGLNVERDAGLLGGIFQSGSNPFQTTDLNSNVFSNLFRTNSSQGVSGTVGSLAGASF